MNGTNLFKIALRALANNKLARLPHDAGYHHRCGIRHHHARHRAGLEEKYPGTDLGNGLQYDYDSSSVSSRSVTYC